MTNVNFSDWLSNILAERNLKPVELARLARIDPSMVTRILNAERSATPKTLEAIARALKLPSETVYRAAGLLPPVSPANEKIEKINHALADLSEEEQADILEYINLRIKIAEERAAYKAARKRGSRPVEESN